MKQSISMNYIGSKHKLLKFTTSTIYSVVGEDLSDKTVCDIFAGTGIVGRKFKLHFINSVLLKCNSFIGEDYQPFDDFQQFNEDEVPSNSDITFILSQYIQSLEKFRSDNIYMDMGSWYYRLTDKRKKNQN